MTAPARIPCSVPFCRRTAPADGRDTEIICGNHWRRIPVQKRQEYLKAKQRAIAAPISMFDEYCAAWASIKAEAIERAIG